MTSPSSSSPALSQRDILLIQSMRNTIMVASVLASAALLGVMAFVGATHGLKAHEAAYALRLVVGAMALIAVAFSVLALVLLSRASHDEVTEKIEADWRRAHLCVSVAGIAFVLFAFGALLGVANLGARYECDRRQQRL
jgi:beta-lactamase regulating signal transducer with metallopeptidase domain